MKRYLACTVALFFLFSFSYANATLLGVDGYFALPKVHFNLTGEIDYNWDGAEGTFSLDGRDDEIEYASGNIDWLSGSDYTTSFHISFSLDEHGNLIAKNPAIMTEMVSAGTLNLDVDGDPSTSGDNYSYGPGTILIQGKVIGVGWDSSGGHGDFLINSLSGKFVDDMKIWDTKYNTGIAVWVVPSVGWSWTSSWNTNNLGSKVLGIKAPLTANNISEPGTLLLLGSGLIGLAGYARLKRKKS